MGPAIFYSMRILYRIGFGGYDVRRFFPLRDFKPTEFSVAMVIPAGLTICVLVATWRGSAKPAIRLWKETNGLRVMNRGLWSLGAFSCPFLVPDAFDAWRGRREPFPFSGNLEIGDGKGRV